MPDYNPAPYRKKYQASLKYLQTKKRLLFITTSTRWAGSESTEQPKSTRLAHQLAKEIGLAKVKIVDEPSLKIYPCEGNVSTAEGNTCGQLAAMLGDPKKNPSGQHRCWASIHNPDDELWKISQPLLWADCVVFFGSVRWGQMNAQYGKLIERLTWLENRHSTLGESNLLAKIDVGLIAVGHNWRGERIVDIQKQVLDYFGFHTVDDLFWNWQYTTPDDETNRSYKAAAKQFERTFFASTS